MLREHEFCVLGYKWRDGLADLIRFYSNVLYCNILPLINMPELISVRLDVRNHLNITNLSFSLQLCCSQTSLADFGLGQICRGCGDCSVCTPCPN